MLYLFKTKANINGHKNILAIHQAGEEKIYTRENNFFNLSDFIEIKSGDRKKMILDLDNAGFKCVDCNTFRKTTGF